MQRQDAAMRELHANTNLGAPGKVIPASSWQGVEFNVSRSWALGLARLGLTRINCLGLYFSADAGYGRCEPCMWGDGGAESKSFGL